MSERATEPRRGGWENGAAPISEGEPAEHSGPLCPHCTPISRPVLHAVMFRENIYHSRGAEPKGGSVQLPRLALVRSRADLTQEELAERAGVNRSSIAKCETGAQGTSLRTALKIADALGVSVEDLGGEIAPKARGPRSYSRVPGPQPESLFDEPAAGEAISGIWQGVRALPGPEFPYLTRLSRTPDERYGRLIDAATPEDARRLAAELGEEVGVLNLLSGALPSNAVELAEVRDLIPIARERRDRAMHRAIIGEARLLAEEMRAS